MTPAQIELTIKRLLRMGAPKAFAMLVLLVASLAIPSGESDCSNLEVLELFAGTARLCRSARSLGIPAEAHDILFDPHRSQKGKSAMDINEPAGFLLPGILGPPL
ncbi:unnamed protein product [Effrenium voratum]|uniref:Uncharacterized protein n=1 Tax=Effrenium voratum TaxID=2562239 RepID=A0AA36NCD5_9DINO|nr:unnamed protein product [Effrenium voratum]